MKKCGCVYIEICSKIEKKRFLRIVGKELAPAEYDK